MPELRLRCELPVDISLRDFSSFQEDVSTLYDRLVFLYVAPDSPIVYSPQFRHMLYRLPAGLNLGLYDLRRQNPVNFGLKIPEIIAEIKNFLKEGLEIGRDWQNVRRKGQLENDRIEIENDFQRTRLSALREEIARQRELHIPETTKARFEIEEEVRQRYLTGPSVEMQPRLEGVAPKQLPEIATVKSDEPQLQNSSPHPISRSVSDATTAPKIEQDRRKALDRLGRDITRLSQSSVRILSVEEVTAETDQDNKAR